MNHLDIRHPRFATIKSSALGDHVIPCLFVDVTGKRLLVETEAAIKASVAVTVEFDDSLFLGEVITCRQENKGFDLEIKVEQVLSGLQSLIALRSRLLCDAPVHAPVVSSFTHVLAGR